MRRTLSALALAVAPAAATADCAADLALIETTLTARGYTIGDNGQLDVTDDTCIWTGGSLAEQTLQIDFAGVAWTLDGKEALASGDGRVELGVEIDGLRLTGRSGDPWVDYVLREQNRRNLVDVTLRAFWDVSTGEAAISILDIDLPGANGVLFTGALSGVPLSLMAGDPAAFAAVRLEEMTLRVENRGFLDGLLVGGLMGRASDVAGNPEQVVEATKTAAKEIVSGWPEPIFPESSRDALMRLIGAGPLPWGVLSMVVESDGTFDPARFIDGQGLSAAPMSREAVAEALNGLQFDIQFTSAD